jgi:cation diffusion facilitator CzcD-associated flavoprotein CzcO
MSYSYTFATNPDWSCPFPQQPELLAYIQAVARHFKVTHLFTCNRKTERAEWNEEKGVWKVDFVDLVDRGMPATSDSPRVPGSESSFEFHFLFNSTHSTNEPGLPMIPGALEEAFKGDSWHSMRWPKDGLERCRGKRVVMLGCAAAAIQLAPEIAKVASKLVILGRTPNHIIEKPNDPFPEEMRKKWRENPMEMRMYRAKFEQEFALTWFETGFVHGSPRWQKYMDSFRRNVDQVKDESLRKSLEPDFDLWCRRALFSSTFYPTLNLPHVEYVMQKIKSRGRWDRDHDAKLA